jgi:hypothetical protein
MAKYMIHACLDRMWYVEKYLVPSMFKQGISRNDITIYTDANGDGCLKSHVKSFQLASEMFVDGIWHLQDDVIICRDFKERTEQYDNGVVCGFSSYYDERKHWMPGDSNGLRMWYSFPCIRIPTDIIKEYTNWFNTYVWRDPQYEKWVKANKYDDTIFRIWMEQYHPYTYVLNMSPNLVDHVDFLLGGSKVNPNRIDKQVRALSFDDVDLINELEKEIENDLRERKS